MREKRNFLYVLLAIFFVGCGSPSEFKPNPTVNPQIDNLQINQAPTATPQNITLSKNTTKAITLSGTDPNGDVLTYIVTKPPINGIFENGVYTPTPNYHGNDSFSFTANDGFITSEPEVINITIDDNTEVNTDTIYRRVRAATVQIKKQGTEGSKWGTGFFVDLEGHIVTSNQAVVGATELLIDIEGEDRLINAKLIGYAECADLAIIKLTLSRDDYKYLNWFQGNIAVGMNIASSGFLSDITFNNGVPIYTYTEGKITTLPNDMATTWAYTNIFYHSANTAKGHLGGPLIDLETGKVIGVTYAINKDNGKQLAISGNFAKINVDRMINGENINSIGINPKVYQHSDGKYYGVRVKNVVLGKHADKIGIKANDLIIELANSSLVEDNHERVFTLEKYCSILRTNNPNNPNDAEDKGMVSSIKILRFTQNNKWVECSGEINGNHLKLTDDSTVDCPDEKKITFDKDGYMIL